MLGKLGAKDFLRVRYAFKGRHGNLELTTAKSAGTDGRNRAKPFEHPKSTFFHHGFFQPVNRY